MPVMVVSRKIKANCFLCATRKRPWAKLSVYGCSHAWMFPGTLKTGERIGIRHSQRDMCRREQPCQHVMSLKRFEIFCILFLYNFHTFFLKNLLEKWKPLADKKSQTTSQRARTRSIKRQQIRAKLRRAYCVVYKNSGIEITSSSTDMTSWYTSEYWFKKNRFNAISSCSQGPSQLLGFVHFPVLQRRVRKECQKECA